MSGVPLRNRRLKYDGTLMHLRNRKDVVRSLSLSVRGRPSGLSRPPPEIDDVTSSPSSSTHVVHVSAAARRPAYWKLAAHLWGPDCNIDSDGNSRTPDDEEWTELTLSLRGEPGQFVTVDPIADQPATLAIRSSDPALAEKVAAFLDGSRRGPAATVGQELSPGTMAGTPVFSQSESVSRGDQRHVDTPKNQRFPVVDVRYLLA